MAALVLLIGAIVELPFLGFLVGAGLFVVVLMQTVPLVIAAIVGGYTAR